MNHSIASATTLVEEGAAFTKLEAAGLSQRDRAPASRSQPAPRQFQVVVIGGGQAGLSVGYHLARRGLSFVILDANGRVGDAWRNRWDSLRLFTPARFDGLDGMKFPAPKESFPSKDAMADRIRCSTVIHAVSGEHADRPRQHAPGREREADRDHGDTLRARADADVALDPEPSALARA